MAIIFTATTGTDNPLNGVNVGSFSSPTFADVDGDGDLDAFIGEDSGNINYFENDGGTFTEITGAANPFNGVAVGSNSSPTFADVDGDGDLDAFIGEENGNINYFENDGGTFTEITGAANPLNGVNVGSLSTPTFADVDGDGGLGCLYWGRQRQYFLLRERRRHTFTEITACGQPTMALVWHSAAPPLPMWTGMGTWMPLLGNMTAISITSRTTAAPLQK